MSDFLKQMEKAADNMARLAAKQKTIDRKNGVLVPIRVLKKGDGKIATGEYDEAENAFTYHARNDVLKVPRSTADAHEDAGMAEILSEDEWLKLAGDEPTPERRGPGRPPKAPEQAAA